MLNFLQKMALVYKKIWPQYFDKVASGDKTFEVRLADFDIEAGDELVLQEWNPETGEYTGREIRKSVGYVLKLGEAQGLYDPAEVERYGYQIISLKD